MYQVTNNVHSTTHTCCDEATVSLGTIKIFPKQCSNRIFRRTPYSTRIDSRLKNLTPKRHKAVSNRASKSIQWWFMGLHKKVTRLWQNPCILKTSSAQNYNCTLANNNQICHRTNEITTAFCPWENFAVYSQDNHNKSQKNRF